MRLSDWRGTWTVFRKEFLENLRDRRTLLSALVLGPVFGPLLFAGVMQFTMKKTEDATDDVVKIAVSHAERAPNLIDWLSARGFEIERVEYDDAQARAAVASRKHLVVIDVREDFVKGFTDGTPAPLSVYLDASRQFDARASARVARSLQQYSQQIAQLRLVARGVDPLAVAPIAVQQVDVSTPASRSLLLLGMLSYILIFTMLFGGLYLAVDATAGERERGSLESLLTTPVPRANLIYGKILAAAAYMLVSLCLTVTSLTIVIPLIGLERYGMSANLTPATAPVMIAYCAPLALLGAAFLTIASAFAKSYREAQSYLGVMMTVPTLPLIFAGLLGLTATSALMFVPFLSQHLLITTLLRNETVPVPLLTTSVVATLALGCILAWIAGKLYKREALLG